jgi:hypothetical protein
MSWILSSIHLQGGTWRPNGATALRTGFKVAGSAATVTPVTKGSATEKRFCQRRNWARMD